MHATTRPGVGHTAFVFLLWLAVTATIDASAADGPAQRLPTIDDKTNGCQRAEGYFNFHLDAAAGTVWLEIDRWDDDFLMVDGLSAGLGSNPVGLDRGRWGDSRVALVVASF